MARDDQRTAGPGYDQRIVMLAPWGRAGSGSCKAVAVRTGRAKKLAAIEGTNRPRDGGKPRGGPVRWWRASTYGWHCPGAGP